MPLHRFISAGSNTLVVDGPGRVYGVLAGGANGGTLFVLDTDQQLGLTPNYVTLPASISSNIAVISPLPATPTYWPLYGTSFTDGLTVAATSSSDLTVIYSE